MKDSLVPLLRCSALNKVPPGFEIDCESLFHRKNAAEVGVVGNLSGGIPVSPPLSVIDFHSITSNT
jgi:hypothetical protein